MKHILKNQKLTLEFNEKGLLNYTDLKLNKKISFKNDDFFVSINNKILNKNSLDLDNILKEKNSIKKFY